MSIAVSEFSRAYSVRELGKDDLGKIYELCSRNKLYYQHCPPDVTEKSILDDMKALPPGKELHDKYYVGYFEGDTLVAVMDFIMAYPNEKTAFIGFFMTDVSKQNKGVGSKIVGELRKYLQNIEISSVRLGWVKGNPQAEHFWHKNGFVETGTTYDTDGYTVVAENLL